MPAVVVTPTHEEVANRDDGCVEEETCVICMEETVSLRVDCPGAHDFCSACILAWKQQLVSKASSELTCPNCRAEVKAVVEIATGEPLKENRAPAAWGGAGAVAVVPRREAALLSHFPPLGSTADAEAVREAANEAEAERRRAAEDAQRRAAAEAEARRNAEAEARREAYENLERRRRASAAADLARLSVEAETEMRRRAEDEAEMRRRAAFEVEWRRCADAEARRRADADADAEARRVRAWQRRREEADKRGGQSKHEMLRKEKNRKMLRKEKNRKKQMQNQRAIERGLGGQQTRRDELGGHPMRTVAHPWQPPAEPFEGALYFPAHYAAGFYCQLAHGVDELRSPPETLASPEGMLGGRRFKTRLCKYFLAGHCPYAATNTCQFAHSNDELKTRLCKYFLAGHCPYAATNTCQFAHSNDELRAPLDGGNGAGPGVSD